ncbi:phage tail family protein [Ruminococcaceae bacterium OttesenSCG-928-I18]|nr:phage tail family protein [Ruminococcaceae bacterium OttesenSCG-928-I18]
MRRRVEFVNEDNLILSADYNQYSPVRLLKIEGVTAITNSVVTTDNSMIDGSTHQGTTTKERHIELTFEMFENYKQIRDILYLVFKPKTTGTFYYTENGETRRIQYEPEDIDIDNEGVVRNIVVSLKCTDPYFEALDETVVDMAAWDALFEFEHEFLEEGEELATRIAEIIKEVPNESAAKNLGITVQFTAEGPVFAPAIYHLESGDFARVAVDLMAGDSVVYTTHTNNKKVFLFQGGEKREVNELLDEDSEFIQLGPKKNTLKYDADSGIEYLNVQIIYRFKFAGV